MLRLKNEVVETYTEDVNQEIKTTGARLVFALDTLRFYSCPRSYIRSETTVLLDLLMLEESPPKVFPGGWPDQPHWWIEAIRIYKSERTKWLEQTKA